MYIYRSAQVQFKSPFSRAVDLNMKPIIKTIVELFFSVLSRDHREHHIIRRF